MVLRFATAAAASRTPATLRTLATSRTTLFTHFASHHTLAASRELAVWPQPWQLERRDARLLGETEAHVQLPADAAAGPTGWLHRDAEVHATVGPAHGGSGGSKEEVREDIGAGAAVGDEPDLEQGHLRECGRCRWVRVVAEMGDVPAWDWQ